MQFTKQLRALSFAVATGLGALWLVANFPLQERGATSDASQSQRVGELPSDTSQADQADVLSGVANVSAVALGKPGSEDTRQPVEGDELGDESVFSASIEVKLATGKQQIDMPIGATVLLSTRGMGSGEDAVLQKAGALQAVKVTAGRWSGQLGKSVYEVVGVRGEDQAYQFEPGQVLSVENSRLTIEVSALTEWTLELTDAISGAPIALDELWGLAPKPKNLHRILATAQEGLPVSDVVPIETAGASPGVFRVQEEDSRGFFWATAEGYGCKNFERNANQRNVHLELTPVGSIELRVAPIDAQSLGLTTAEIQAGMFRVEFTPELELFNPYVFGGERLKLEDVPVGEYSVAVRYEDGLSNSVLFESQVMVHAGEQTRVPVQLREPLGTGHVELTVLLSDQARLADWHIELWRNQRSEMAAYPAGTSSSMVGSLELAGWDFEEQAMGLFASKYFRMEAGDYTVRVEPLGLQQNLSVQAGSSGQYLVDALQTVALPLDIQGINGKQDVRVRWGYQHSSSGFGERSLESFVERDRFLLDCLPLPLWVQVVCESSESKRVDLVPSKDSDAVALNLLEVPYRQVRFSAWSGGAHAHASQGFWSSVQVQPIGHSGASVRQAYGELGTAIRIADGMLYPDWSQCVMTLTAPGPYQLLETRNGRTRELCSFEVLPEAQVMDVPFDMTRG